MISLIAPILSADQTDLGITQFVYDGSFQDSCASSVVESKTPEVFFRTRDPFGARVVDPLPVIGSDGTFAGLLSLSRSNGLY